MLYRRYFFVGIVLLFSFIRSPLYATTKRDGQTSSSFQLLIKQPIYSLYTPPIIKHNFTRRIRLLQKIFDIATKKDNESKDEDGPAIVKYEATESISIDMATNQIGLHGKSKIEYDKFQLEAEEIALDWKTHTITATGKKNEIGMFIGNPIFTLEEVDDDKYGKKSGNSKKSVYFSEKIAYNIDSKKAIVHKMVTKRDDAIMKSKKIKKEDEDTFYMKEIRYTTCNLPHPHFYIYAKQSKMVLDHKIVSGPLQFYFDDVPMPLGFFFGTLFLPGKRKHGILPPEPGDDSTRGYYLKNGGYYFRFNDYATLTLQGDIYTSGETAMRNQLHYAKRYLCEGKFNYNLHSVAAKNGWNLEWYHKTDGARCNRGVVANVNIESEAYHDNKSQDLFEDNTINNSARTKSSIRYYDHLGRFPYHLDLEIMHDKEFKPKVNKVSSKLPEEVKKETLTLPNILLKTGKLYPFKLKKKIFSGRSWYGDIYKGLNVQHSLLLLHKLSNVKKGVPVAITHNKLDKISNGVLHTIPIETNVKLFNYFNLKPVLNYQERWYWEKLDYNTEYPSEESMRPKIIKGFNRVYDYNIGTTLSTTLYAAHIFSKNTNVQAIRFKTMPQVGFNYTPDFAKPSYNYYQNIKVAGKEVNKSRFEDFIHGTPPAKKEKSLTMELNNTLSLKINKEGETADKKETKYIDILRELSFHTKYDFAAKEFPLDNINLKLATGKIKVKNMTIQTGGVVSIDPYMYQQIQGKEKKIKELTWHHGKYLGRVDKASFNIHTSWQGGGKGDKKDKKKETADLPYQSLFTDDDFQKGGEFDTPWKLGLTYNWNYERNDTATFFSSISSQKGNKKKIRQSIDFNGDFLLTKKWKFGIKGKYNITDKKFIYDATKVLINRDLHCWEIRYTWNPFGETSKYDFSIGIKAEALKLLKYPRKKTYKNIKKTQVTIILLSL